MNNFDKLDSVSKNISRKNTEQYYVMNKDVPLIEFSYKDGIARMGKILCDKLPPDITNRFNAFLDSRTIPKYRTYFEELMRQIGVEHNDRKSIIDFFKGLSLTDTLWITNDLSLKWESVSLYRNELDEVISKIAFDGGFHGGKVRTVSPEFATGGVLAKTWVREENGIFLYKRGREGAANLGYEPYSEAMATQVCEALEVNHVHYDVVNFRGKLASKCPLITNEDVSMLPIYSFILDTSTEAVHIFLEEQGLLKDYAIMNVLDYILLNHDRHLGNYSLLVKSTDFSIIGAAPIYDNGEGCLCNYRERMYKSLEEYTEPREKEFYNLAIVNIKKSLQLSNVNVKKLINFKFDSSRLLDCPEEHIKIVESFIADRVQTLLRM